MSEKRIPEDVARLRLDLWSAGIRQRDIADLLGMSEPAVSNYLNGRTPLPADRVARIKAFIAERVR